MKKDKKSEEEKYKGKRLVVSRFACAIQHSGSRCRGGKWSRWTTELKAEEREQVVRAGESRQGIVTLACGR